MSRLTKQVHMRGLRASVSACFGGIRVVLGEVRPIVVRDIYWTGWEGYYNRPDELILAIGQAYIICICLTLFGCAYLLVYCVCGVLLCDCLLLSVFVFSSQYKFRRLYRAENPVVGILTPYYSYLFSDYRFTFLEDRRSIKRGVSTVRSPLRHCQFYLCMEN
ncbi:hypothetical protein PIB30_004551 [Stylosanthes scabra]|uniref:Uncharacterized protein n=1 Tax=Stylosanthes scabra TaxID=79078 RepID=A0ABU6Y1Z9_9FABA|nr:hypothetical protein [Stylosanthes scabra]